jgi:hypothetical protein
VPISLIHCSFSSYDNNTTDCEITEAGKAVKNWLLNLISTPTAVQFLRLSPFVIVVDEFSYYSYHTTRYDRGFRFLVDFCWEFNNAKWVPPMLEDTYSKLTEPLEAIQIADWANVTPRRFAAKGDSVYFLNNAEDFLFVSVPLSITGFVLAWLIRKKVQCWRIPALFAPFTTFSYLFDSLLGNNIQYLSFRAFQQLRFIVPRSFVDGLSVVLAIVVLFSVVFCACALYLLIWSLDHKYFRIDHLTHCLESFKLTTLILQARVLAGFIHAYLDNEKNQLMGLVLLSMTVLGVAVRYYFAYRKKRGVAVSIYTLLTKMLINIVLNIEAGIQFQEGLPNEEEESMSSLATLMLYTLATLLVLQYSVSCSKEV